MLRTGSRVSACVAVHDGKAAGSRSRIQVGMTKKFDKVVLLPSKPGERAPETREEEAQALVDYFRNTEKISSSAWWRLGLSVATMWQGLLAQPGASHDLLRLLFVLNCSRSLGSVWLFMNLMLNRWGHNEMLGTGVLPSSTALWDAVEHALSEDEGYCLGCYRFYDVTASTAGMAPSPSCPNCGRQNSINLTVCTPHLCPACFQAKSLDVRTCDLCQSRIEAVIVRNRIESWP